MQSAERAVPTDPKSFEGIEPCFGPISADSKNTTEGHLHVQLDAGEGGEGSLGSMFDSQWCGSSLSWPGDGRADSDNFERCRSSLPRMESK
jgi:hypothetical protein